MHACKHTVLLYYLTKLCCMVDLIVHWQCILETIRQHGSAVYVGMVVVVCML